MQFAKEVCMKFLLIVMAIHFVAELVGKKNDKNRNDHDGPGGTTMHPAGFNLR